MKFHASPLKGFTPTDLLTIVGLLAGTTVSATQITPSAFPTIFYRVTNLK
jgi:hypothetical protein